MLHTYIRTEFDELDNTEKVEKMFHICECIEASVSLHTNDVTTYLDDVTTYLDDVITYTYIYIYIYIRIYIYIYIGW